MIPSPTKLALLTGIVLLIGEVNTYPDRYDQRQDGDLNFRADVEDVILVAVPPKDSISNAMSWFGANFIRHNPNRIPSRTSTKHGFAPTEKSPYKVDLGKSTVPLVKLLSPVVEEVKLYKIRDAAEEGATKVGESSKIIMTVSEASTTTTESKTVKKELKASTEAVVSSTEAVKKSEEFVVLGDSTSPTVAEGCGPQAHRDSTGKCVYE